MCKFWQRFFCVKSLKITLERDFHKYGVSMDSAQLTSTCTVTIQTSDDAVQGIFTTSPWSSSIYSTMEVTWLWLGTYDVTISWGHIVMICNFPCLLPKSKINGKARSECLTILDKFLPSAHQSPPSLHSCHAMLVTHTPSPTNHSLCMTSWMNYYMLSFNDLTKDAPMRQFISWKYILCYDL